MGTAKTLFGNHILNIIVISWAAAQIIKTILAFISNKEFSAERLVGSGGMPSSHTSLVCSLTVAVLRTQGFNSPLFAICFAFAAVVMYDATGVRRAAGEQAKVLNMLVKSIMSKEHDVHKRTYEALKEYLGHTPMEVLGGAILGIFIASVYPL